MNPQLREAIEIQLIQDQSEKIILLSCRIGVSEPLALIYAVGPVLMMLDGSHSEDAIKQHFREKNVDVKIIERVLQLLDEKLYLSGNRFLERKERILSEYRSSPFRPAAHAGRIYPSDPSELNRYLEGILKDQNIHSKTPDNMRLAALVAPHIDYRRGSIGYAHAYSQLADQKPDICILIGTSHQAGRSLFQLTDKHFECPNGTLEIEKDFVSELIGGYGENRALADELLHRQEHSLELQIPFLNYFCPKTKIVPILVGGFYPYLRNDSGPSSDSEYSDFVECLAENIRKFSDQGARITIVAGVDMAHVGKNFGDQFILSPEKMAEIESEDMIYLDSISNLSSAGMFRHIAKDLDQRRICGFSTMHTVIDVLKLQNREYQVRLLDYRQAADLNTQCLVSFAAMGIYEHHQNRT